MIDGHRGAHIMPERKPKDLDWWGDTLCPSISMGRDAHGEETNSADRNSDNTHVTLEVRKLDLLELSTQPLHQRGGFGKRLAM